MLFLLLLVAYQLANIGVAETAVVTGRTPQTQAGDQDFAEGMLESRFYTENTLQPEGLVATVTPPIFLIKWGAFGADDGQFDMPTGIASGPKGNVYAVDRNNHRIQKFDENGVFLTEWGGYGTGNGQFDTPRDVAVTLAPIKYHVYLPSIMSSCVCASYEALTDREHIVAYVIERNNHRGQKFDAYGNFLGKVGRFGESDGQFNRPHGVAVDREGNIYVADSGNHRIQKFDSSVSFLTKWGNYGTGDGQFDYPVSVATDWEDNVYVADRNNHRIQKFDETGDFLGAWGSPGSENGQFAFPTGVTVDWEGTVYVADRDNHRIQMFTKEGTFLGKWGSFGSGDGQFAFPTGVAVDWEGNVFVTDRNNHRVQKFGR